MISHLVKKTRGFRDLKEVSYDIPTELCESAELNFDIEKRNLFYRSFGRYTPDMPASPKKAVIRTDTDELLGVVGNRYKPIQNLYVATIADKIATACGGVIDLAGACHVGNYASGSRVVFHADLGEMTVGDDKMNKQIIITNSHDTSMALTIFLGVFRVICSNGMVAFDKDHSNIYKIRHTDNYMQTAENAIENLSNVNEFYLKVKEDLTSMMYRKLIEPHLSVKYLGRKMFPSVVRQTETGSKTVVTPSIAANRERLITLYDEQEVEGDNVYRIYRAATDFIDHEKKIRFGVKNEDSAYLQSTLAGSSNELKHIAFDKCMELVNG